MPIPLPIASYNQAGRNPGRLVNCYAQQSLSTKGPVELLSVPGIVSHATLSGPGRGMIVVKDVLYAVGGTTFYSVSSGGTATSLGTVPGTGRLTFAANASEIMFSNGYYYNGTTVAAISDTDLPALDAIDFVDGYVLGVESGTGRFVGCALNDVTTWDALNFATAEGSPDNLVTIKVANREVILPGQDSTEEWWNSGVSGFPFERKAGGFRDIGCLAKHGICKADNTVWMLASDRTIRASRGGTWQRMSQHGVEAKIASYASVSDCVAFSYTWNAHIFVVFRFPSAGACWVLDVTTNEWHERSTYGETDWLISDAVHAHGRVYVQHSLTGAIGYLDDDTNTEWGGILRRETTFNQVYGSNRRLFHGSLELVCKTGDAPIGTTPYIHLEISDDGGSTWRELPRREIGNVGEYAQRIRWHRLGSSRDRVYRVYVSDDVTFRLLAAELEVTG